MAKSSLEDYKAEFPGLWDAKKGDNFRLISLTRKYSTENKPEIPADKIETNTNSSWEIIWNNLFEQLSNIKELSDLLKLNDRLDVAFKIIKVANEYEEKKDLFKLILIDILSLDQERSTGEELRIKLARINSMLKEANEVIEKNHIFKVMRPLYAAYLRVFENLTKSLHSYNKPVVGEIIVGEGLPDDISATSPYW